MRPPFRADHVGSLLRPHELHDLREQVRMGKADAAKLKEAEDRLIRYLFRRGYRSSRSDAGSVVREAKSPIRIASPVKSPK